MTFNDQNHSYNWVEKSLQTIHKANWYRQVKTITNYPDSLIELEGKKLINFASNNYLGLAQDSHLIEAAIKALNQYGTSSTGSRLLTGNCNLHDQLELAIAKLKQTESALVFSSGYLANLGIIACLVGEKDLIFSDQYNHSSLKKGAKLSTANIIEYQHLNIADLERQLILHKHKYRRCLIITDSVFSMDGDLCPLPELIELSNKYQTMLLIDDAHATGILGKKGGGCADFFHCSGSNFIQIGTLSKALGSLGGYVAGSKVIIDFLKNRCPTWIYTTGLSPADTAAALEAINIIKNEPNRREKLWDNVNLFKRLLSPNIKLLPSQSAIVCLPVKNSLDALKIAKNLEFKGIFAPAIRPPTVATSRIRLTFMATHTTEQISYLAEIINNLF